MQEFYVCMRLLYQRQTRRGTKLGRGEASDESDIYHNGAEWMGNSATLYKSIFLIPCRDDAAVYLGKAVPLRSTYLFFSPRNLINRPENNLVPTVFCQPGILCLEAWRLEQD